MMSMATPEHDLLGALVSSHRSGAIKESLGDHNGLVGCHDKAIGKCLVAERCDAFLMNN